MNRNRIRICGRKTITAPTPAKMPSTISERSQPVGQRIADPVAEADDVAASSASAGTADQAKTAWNIRNRMAARMIGPATGCSSTPSSWWVMRRTGVSRTIAPMAISRARRCSVEQIVGRPFACADLARLAAAARSRRSMHLGRCRASGPRRSRPPARRVPASSFAGVELEPVALGEVDHVERDHGRQAEVDQLQREAQVIVEVGGVDHDQQRLRQPLALLLAEQHVAGDRFVGAGRIEAVGAGQVDQFDRRAVGQDGPADVALDRHARIIADLLPGAGQRVEQGALAGIGIADDRDQRQRVHAASAMTWTARAWAGGWRRSSGRPGPPADRGRTGRDAAARS